MSEKKKLLEAGEEENLILTILAMADGEVKLIQEEMQTGEEVVEADTNPLQDLKGPIEVDVVEEEVVKEEEEEEVVTAAEDASALVMKDIRLESVPKEGVEVIEVQEEATGLVILVVKRVTCLENVLTEEVEMLEET
jgi:hypothetical protein